MRTIRKFKLLRDINEEILDSLEDGYFPILLNSNPEKAAISLTIKDAVEAHRILTHIYSNPDLADYKLLRESISYNTTNYSWFYSFYLSLEKNFQKFINAESVIPYPPERKECSYYEIRVFPPYFILPFKNKYRAYIEQYVKDYYMEYPTITKDGTLEMKSCAPSIEILNRVKYIREAYEADEFLNGYPRWYELPVKVFEQYNSKLNKRIRICYENNEFRYFISGASDNWEEIYDVPLEIDTVIHTLLFNN